MGMCRCNQCGWLAVGMCVQAWYITWCMAGCGAAGLVGFALLPRPPHTRSSTLHWWVQAMHRLGKLVRTAKTFDEGVVDKVLGHPQYALLQRRTRQIAGTMTPRAMGNFIWGVRAALECSPTYAVVDPG